MGKFSYLTRENLKNFIEIIQEGDYKIKKYLPSIAEDWYTIVYDCIRYVEQTSHYENLNSLSEILSRLLYKIAKRHELGDGNKRSAVIVAYLTCVINDHIMMYPQKVKYLAKRISSTKGRLHEDIIRKRVAECLSDIVLPYKN